MNYKELIEELLQELSYRVGIVDIYNKEQQSLISEILTEWGEFEAKETIFRFLNEDDADTEGDDKDYVHLGAGIYVLKGDEDNENAQRYKKDDSGSMKAISADAAADIKQSQGEKGKQAAANTPQNQQGGDVVSPEDVEKLKGVKKTIGPSSDYAKKEKERVDSVNNGEETEDEITIGVPGQKDKSLKDVDTTKSEVYTNPSTGVDDSEFEEGDAKPIYEKEEDKLKVSDLDDYFKSGKIPKKYQTVITRLINTENGKQSITSYMSGVGAGQLQSQAGEILTMASIGMSDDEFSGFISKLEEQVSKYPKGKKGVVTKEWLESVKHVRSVTIKRYDSQFGKGNWEIAASAWDVPDEFQALGNDDYTKNKGFSSDMYVKLSVNGKPVLDEVSLKKDTTANIYNGVVTDIKNWSSNVPKSADIDEYKKGEIKRPLEYGKNAQTLQVDRTVLTSESVMKNKELRQTLQALGVVTGDSKKGYTLDSKSEEIITKLESMPIPPPVDFDRFKQTFGTGDKTRFKKFLIIHAACQRAKEISEGNTDKTTAFNFLNNHLGYEKNEDGKFPEGSIKRYQNDTIQFLVDDEEAKEGCLNALAEKLPMKALLSGEEKMAIGGLSADPKTLQKIFGIDNYDDFKAGLTMKEDEDGNNYLVYESKGPPAKSVSIAEVKVRQKGQGYASSVGLEFQIAKEFGKELYVANKELYPPEPEISDKERRKLGV